MSKTAAVTAAPRALRMFIPICKVDEETRTVYGVATAEKADRSGEICDYASTKPYFQAWSADFSKTTAGKSLGNLRAMHSHVAAGKLTAIDFDDEHKSIEIAAKVVDDAEWQKVLEGVYTGFSQGGKYVRRWTDTDTNLTRYTADPSEISLVDYPCLASATFDIVKAGGAAVAKAFKSTIAEPDEAAIEARAAEIHKVDAAAIVKSDAARQAALIKMAREQLIAEALAKADAESVAVIEPSVEQVEAAAKAIAAAEGVAEPTDEHRTQARGNLMAANKAPEQGVGDNVQAMKPGATDAQTGATTLDPAKVPGADPSKTGKGAETEDLVKAAIDALAKDAAGRKDGLAKLLADDSELWMKIPKSDHGAVSSYFKALAANEPAQLWACGNAAHEHITKRGAVRCMGQHKAEEATKTVTAPVDAALAQIEASLGVGKKDYSAAERKKGADEGWAKSDGSYPIKTAADVANAVADFNRSSGSDSDKKHIIARAKAIGAEDKLPDGWVKGKASGKAAAVAMFKADTTAADKAKVHAAMANYHIANAAGDGAEGHRRAAAAHAEAMIAQNAGDATADAKSDTAFQCSRDCLADKCGKVLAEIGAGVVLMSKDERRAAAFVELKKWMGEEVWDAGTALQALNLLFTLLSGEMWEDELAADQTQALRDAIGRVKDFVVSEIKEDNDPEKAMERAVVSLDLAKKGARNSAADQARIQKAHDLLGELGANCKSAASMTDKAMSSEFEKVTSKLSEAEANNKQLTEKIAGYEPRLAELLEIVKRIDSSPAPAKAALFAVGRGPGAGASGHGAQQMTMEQIDEVIAKMNPDERAMLLMKASLRNPTLIISERPA
jgi:hypothetical protein